MWIVRLALRRPHTFVAVSLLLFLLGSSNSIACFPHVGNSLQPAGIIGETKPLLHSR
jgi:hypothetical protein